MIQFKIGMYVLTEDGCVRDDLHEGIYKDGALYRLRQRRVTAQSALELPSEKDLPIEFVNLERFPNIDRSIFAGSKQ